MANRYETIFIMTPVLSDKQVKECSGKFRKFLQNNKANILHEENWGLRKLAYPIQKKTHGFYMLMEFESEGVLISKLETEYKRDERILRFLTIKMDKYAIEFTENKRKEFADKKQKEQQAEIQEDIK